MAKLSVYNTIDRSQLGGKFVPLIQSGVSNYKILASDLGKEYYPGDAIEITDTGEINVKFNSNDFELFNSSLSIKTDDARGVFNGGNGIYIKSADNTINVSYGGIKVNTGYGLSAASNGLFVKHANNTIGVSSHGISVYYGSGLTEDSNTGALIVSDTYVRHNFINKLAGQGLYSYIIGYHDSALGVKSADGTIGVISSGIGVNVTNGGGILTGADGLYIDSAQLAGSGLMASCIEQHNVKLSVKSADNSISVTSEGIKVAEGFGFPDYSAGVTISSGYTVTQKGVISAVVLVSGKVDSAYWELRINNIIFASEGGSYWNVGSFYALVNKGDVITWSGFNQVIFYPLKGN